MYQPVGVHVEQPVANPFACVGASMMEPSGLLQDAAYAMLCIS